MREEVGYRQESYIHKYDGSNRNDEPRSRDLIEFRSKQAQKTRQMWQDRRIIVLWAEIVREGAKEEVYHFIIEVLSHQKSYEIIDAGNMKI